MKRFIKRYWAITLSLTVLFGSGIAAGFRWGQHQGTGPAGVEPAAPGTPELTPEQWAENAAAALQKDLGLNAGQADRVRESIAGPSREIFSEKHRANMKIHLRLLEAHDRLANDVDLTDKQKALLRVRREQLRNVIREKFRDLLGDKPDPLLSDL